MSYIKHFLEIEDVEIDELEMMSFEKTDYTLERINQYLKESRFRKKDVAKTLNITYTSLANKLSGRTDFSIKEIYKLAEVLRVPLSEILDF